MSVCGVTMYRLSMHNIYERFCFLPPLLEQFLEKGDKRMMIVLSPGRVWAGQHLDMDSSIGWRSFSQIVPEPMRFWEKLSVLFHTSQRPAEQATIRDLVEDIGTKEAFSENQSGRSLNQSCREYISASFLKLCPGGVFEWKSCSWKVHSPNSLLLEGSQFFLKRCPALFR